MITVSRRRVLGAGVGSLALAMTGALGTARADAATAHPRAARDAGPTRTDFTRHIGGQYLATAGSGTHRLKLVGVRNPLVRSAEPELSFTLVFKPVHGRLPDDIYTLRRRGARTHALLLTALGDKGLLQAVVNRTHR